MLDTVETAAPTWLTMGMLVAAAMEPTAVMTDVTFLPVLAFLSISVAPALATSTAAMATLTPGANRPSAVAAGPGGALAPCWRAASPGAWPAVDRAALAAERVPLPSRPLARVLPAFAASPAAVLTARPTGFAVPPPNNP